jgi:hypothetical protein
MSPSVKTSSDASTCRARLKKQSDDNLAVALRAEVKEVRFTPETARNFITHKEVESRDDLTKMRDVIFASDPDIKTLYDANVRSFVRVLPGGGSIGKGPTGNRWLTDDAAGLVDERVMRTMITLNEACGDKGMRALKKCNVMNPPCSDTHSAYLYAADPEERITAKTVTQVFRAADNYDSYRNFLDSDRTFADLEAEGEAASGGVSYKYDGKSRKRCAVPIPTLHTATKPRGRGCGIFDEVICKDEWRLNSRGGLLSGNASVNQNYQNVESYYYRDAKDPPKIKYIMESMWRCIDAVSDIAGPCRGSAKGLDHADIHDFVWSFVGLFSQAGLDVSILICDGASYNHKFIRLATGDPYGATPWCTNGWTGERLYFRFDDPHALKNVRNQLSRSRLSWKPRLFHATRSFIDSGFTAVADAYRVRSIPHRLTETEKVKAALDSECLYEQARECTLPAGVSVKAALSELNSAVLPSLPPVD